MRAAIQYLTDRGTLGCRSGAAHVVDDQHAAEVASSASSEWEASPPAEDFPTGALATDEVKEINDTREKYIMVMSRFHMRRQRQQPGSRRVVAPRRRRVLKYRRYGTRY